MPALIDAIDIKRKMYFEFENAPYYCLDVEVSTPTARGGQTLVRLKMRNLLTRAVFDKTFKASDKFKEPDLETVEASYLYSDGDGSYFLDQETFDTITLTRRSSATRSIFCSKGVILQIDKFNGNPIGLQLPEQVELAVTYTEPGARGDTASGSRHQARQARNRPRNPRPLLRRRRRKGQGLHRNSRVRRPRVAAIAPGHLSTPQAKDAPRDPGFIA